MTRKFDSFSGLLRGALGDRLVDATTTIDLFTDDVIFEFPYAPEGLPRKLVGRTALAGHLARLGPLLEFDEMTLGDVYPSGQTVVFEFSCRGRGTTTGAAYNQNYVSVIRLREGRIAHYRDYWNPLVVLSALGGAEKAATAFAGEATHG